MRTYFGLTYKIDASVTYDAQRLVPLGPTPPDQIDRFEQKVYDLLSEIDKEETVGRHILRGGWIGQTISIVPGTAVAAIPLKPADAMPKGATKVTPKKTFRGTGTGSEVMLFLTPPKATPLFGPGTQKDAALLHEIVHAVRITHGLFHQVPMAVYDDLEEFYAVTLANMYISAKYPGAPLRGDHKGTPLHKVGGYDKVTAMLTHPGLAEQKLYYFAQQNRDELVKLIGQMESLCLWLKDAPCRFNPLRVAYNGYDPDVEEAALPKERRRKQGYGPFVHETFAQAAARLLKDSDPEKVRQMYGGDISDRFGGL
jgi:hypothetical protein